MKDNVLVGRTRKTFGVDGTLKLEVEDRYLDDVLAASVLFVGREGRLLPYFIESIQEGGSLLVKFEEINSKEAAVPITSKDIYLRSKDVRLQEDQPEGEFATVNDLVGFNILLPNKKLVGLIKSVEEYPQQDMAVVDYKGRTILIPLSEPLILEFILDEKQIIMDLPEGLLDL